MDENLELKIHYLEMIQSIITRMASNSFMLKGWFITLIAGIFALSTIDTNKAFFLIPYILPYLFWALDSYYLQLERKYRVLYNQEIIKGTKDISFTLSIPKSEHNDKTTYLQCLFSITQVLFYVLPGFLIIIVMYLST